MSVLSQCECTEKIGKDAYKRVINYVQMIKQEQDFSANEAEDFYSIAEQLIKVNPKCQDALKIFIIASMTLKLTFDTGNVFIN